VVISLANLMEYPYVSKLLEEGKISVFGWHFDVETGEIIGINPDTGFFDSIS
jgi:carbonic anhydrase